MFSSALRGGLRRFALVGALVALMAAATASAAAAEVVVTPSSNLEAEDVVEVSGTTVPAGTDDVAIVVCNMAAIPGTRCDTSSATVGFVSEAEYTTGVPIAVQRGPWDDWNFTTGTPFKAETQTTCMNSKFQGDPCSVVVSFYETTGEGKVVRLGAATKSILFK